MPIDWSKFTGPHDACTCSMCDFVFASYGKYHLEDGKGSLVSKDPCPRCGSTRMRRVSSPPELMTISSGDVDERSSERVADGIVNKST